MSEPFELISKGLELAAQEKFSEAEQYILQGIKDYHDCKDQEGVVYGLGRLGYCYEQAGQVEKARLTYEKAVQYGTDIPATFYSLISILVMAGQFDRAFEVAEIWQKKGTQNISGRAQEVFISLSSSLVYAERFAEAIQLLRRTLPYFPQKEFPDQYWQIRGLIGNVLEQEGKLDEAMQLYAEAISEGSTDTLNFNRYLINLEKQKQYQTALKVVNKALTIQKNAAWEAELKKRKQRLEHKTGAVPKGTPKTLIPDFSIRAGARNLVLLQQVQFSPQLSHLTMLGDHFYGTTGGKTPKLFCYRLGEAIRVWEAPLELEADPAGIVAVDGRIIAYTRSGRVGDGITALFFFDTSGQLLSQQRLPDVPSEVKAVAGRLYVGCRDGKLYAFSVDGRGLWSYRVPGSEGGYESVYSRPCPYYVAAGKDIVAFTSFGTLYVLNSEGKLLYTWGMPEHSQTSKNEFFTITISTGAPPVVALAVAPVGRNVLIASRDKVYELVDGKEIQKSKIKFDSINHVYWIKAGICGICDSEKFLIIENGDVKAKVPAKGFSQAAFDFTANRLVIWCGTDLSVATMNGKLLAEVEFVKSVHSVMCIEDGRILVGTRYALLFDSNPESQPINIITPGQRLAGSTSEGLKQRPDEENGFPIRWIEAQRLTIGKGKAYYKGANGKELTIEQIVLERLQNEGYGGQWTENAYWWEIMALLFWDVIYARLPGVYTPQFGEFPSRNQDMPMDFFKPEFFIHRKGLIQRRIQELTAPRMLGLVKPSIEAELKASFQKHYGKPCRPIEDWKRFSFPVILKAAQVLSDKQILLIVYRLLQNFNENRRGMPDLFLVDPSGKPRFAEVKSEKEKVEEHQINWLTYLRDRVNIPVEICRVITL
jgi:tetratricopeptide (TPR) repeat protein